MLRTIRSVCAADEARIGAKACDLAALVRQGIPVPEASVVPTDVFEAYLRRIGAWELAEQVARSGEARAAGRLRQTILTTLMTSAERESIEAEAARLGSLLAVRSSAIGEDGAENSFAGVHETVLSVAPCGVETAIRQCWASLYAEAGLAYRGGRGPAPGSMGVVVQRMLDPDVSGVLFTINPLNGSWREMVIESTWGLCEPLVSGRITPHWYLVRRPRRAPRPVERVLSRVRLHVVQQDLPELGSYLALSSDGPVERSVPAAQRHRATLDRASLMRLCRLGLKLERLRGEPLDIEWALAEGRFWILQARPITAVGGLRESSEGLWTRRFLGERWPQPATPLGWSIMEPILDAFIGYPTVQRDLLDGGRAMRLVHSRPYLNVTVFRHLAFKFPGAPPPRFMLELLPPGEVARWRGRHAAMPDLEVYRAILRVTFEEKRWRLFRWNPFTNHRAWEVFERELADALPELQRPAHSLEASIEQVDEQLEWVRRYVGVHVCSLLFANIWDQILEGLLASWLPEDAAHLGAALATCPPGNRTLETNEALHALASLATSSDLERLAEGKSGSAAFQEGLSAFLERFGHRATSSWEVFTPRYSDAPELLVPLLRARKLPGAEAPGILAQKQERAFRQAQRTLEAQVGGTARGSVLDIVVRLTRQYLLLRENQRFQFDYLLYALQSTLDRVGEELAARGCVARGEDIRFLTLPEVRALASGEDLEVLERIERRRQRWLADGEQQPPVFLRGDDAVASPGRSSRLEGLGISPGRARGRVRLVESLADGVRLQPGDILVARAVDPAWTPLFLTASAVVLEMGSRLSHGAVVAREYGVPAVVNLDGIVGRLRDGDDVTVDGTRGILWLHDEDSSGVKGGVDVGGQSGSDSRNLG